MKAVEAPKKLGHTAPGSQTTPATGSTSGTDAAPRALEGSDTLSTRPAPLALLETSESGLLRGLSTPPDAKSGVAPHSTANGVTDGLGLDPTRYGRTLATWSKAVLNARHASPELRDALGGAMEEQWQAGGHTLFHLPTRHGLALTLPADPGPLTLPPMGTRLSAAEQKTLQSLIGPRLRASLEQFAARGQLDGKSFAAIYPLREIPNAGNGESPLGLVNVHDKDPSFLTKLGAMLGGAALFSAFDYVGYNVARSNNMVPAYRVIQTAAQLGITYGLGKKYGWDTAAGFNMIWWTWGCDLMYYGLSEMLNVGGKWPTRGCFTDEVMHNNVKWAWWTPVGLARGADNQKTIAGKTLLYQAGAGLATAIIMIGFKQLQKWLF